MGRDEGTMRHQGAQRQQSQTSGRAANSSRGAAAPSSGGCADPLMPPRHGSQEGKSNINWFLLPTCRKKKMSEAGGRLVEPEEQ